WLVKTGPVHVGHWGTYVTTPEISPSAATVKIQVTVDNDSESAAIVSVKNEICELKADGTPGGPLASITIDGVQVAPRQNQSSEAQIIFPNPRLWSLERPQRYGVVTSI